MPNEGVGREMVCMVAETMFEGGSGSLGKMHL